jgi:hypothetical protein
MPYKSPSYQQPEYVSLVAAEIAIRIRELGMTPNQVADCCGIDRNAAMRAVRGHHLSARNMDAVLRGLGLTVSSMEARCPS